MGTSPIDVGVGKRYSARVISVEIQQNMRVLATSLMFNEEAVELWHRPMGYLNEADFKRLVSMSKGIMLI